jgi:hypothetical protein
MVTLELTEQEAAMLREMLDVQLRDLRHEIHHTDDRGFRQLLRQKEALLEHLIHQLQAPATFAR